MDLRSRPGPGDSRNLNAARESRDHHPARPGGRHPTYDRDAARPLCRHRGIGRAAALPVNPLEIREQRLPRAIEASVYFLISEALTNVVKHARAKRASVRISITGGMLTVEVRDDRRGLRRGGAGRPYGRWSRGSGARPREALSLESPPSARTMIRAEIPLPEASVHYPSQPARSPFADRPQVEQRVPHPGVGRRLQGGVAA